MDDASKGEDKGPVTPEQVEGEVEVDRCMDVVIPPTAPKGKPKLPPLIHKKIKPAEAGEEDSGPNSGSKIPLLKTKLVDDEEKKPPPKKFTFNVRSGLRKKEDVPGTSNSRLRPQTGASTSSGVDRNDNRNGEAGKPNRGFVVKRGAQESVSGGVISRKGSSVGIAVGASSSQRSLTTAFQKKMTKVESAPLQSSGVKSLAGMASNVASKLNVSVPSAKPAETVTTGDSLPQQNSTDGNPKSQMETAAETATSNFKTVQEFLDMPETTLPETGAGSSSAINNKKTFYKSKFWQYIDPNAKPETASKFKDPKKYNPDEVKSFMQKQKEVRKRQQLKMSKEKKEEYEKRQNMLKQLDTKCKNLAQKSKQRPAPEPSPPVAKHLESVNEAKKRKLELESPSLKYLTPLLERQQGMLLRKSGNLPSDASKQAKFLLSEFENIVKRECISFLQRIPISSGFKLSSKKVDKAVGTQYEGEKESQTQEGDDQEKPLVIEDKEGAKIKSVASPESIEKAVTKIQAFYRGNKVRRTLKLAKIEFRKSLWRKHSDESQQQQQQPLGQRRRWSFPRPPEKPYDNSLQNKILPMSPIPFGGSSSRMIPCYIPPPPPDSLNHTSRSPSRPIVVPSSPFTPVRKRVYDEPYPQQLKNSSSTPGIFPPPPQRHSLPNRTSFNNIAVPTPQPSVMDVLREKIRLFSAAGPEVPDKDGQDQSALQERRDMICKAVSAHLSSTELSPRSATSRQQISDELHESQIEIIPIERKHKRRKKRKDSSPANANDSTTTVDTDLDYANGVRHTSSKSATSLSQKQSDSIAATSETTLSSTTSVVDPSLSSSFGEFLAPALKLRYEAEKEHLKIIEKALQVKLQKAERVESAQQVTNETVKETGKKSSPDSDRVQLAIANCHKESMKAAAEMAKWMADFQKTRQGQQEKEVRQPVDLAAVVFAAVEDARILGEERRREKEMQKIIESSSQKKPTEDHDSSSATPTPVHQQQKHQEVETVDRSAETSLAFNEMVGQTMDRMPFVTVRDKMLKDYQQQYPSATESERESPVVEQFATVTSLSAPAQGEEEASIISEKISKSDQVEVVSTPKSSSTLKSAEVVSEVVFSEEVSKTEPDIVDDASIEDAAGSLSVSKVESLKEHKDDSTIVTEPETQSVEGEVITDHQSVDDTKSEDVSYGHVSIHEIEDEEVEMVSEQALKEEEEQFPSTFESEATTPELSIAPSDRDASVEKSKIILEEGEEQNKEEPGKVELRQDEIPPLTSSATYSDDSQSSSRLLTHKEIDDGKKEEEIVKSESPKVVSEQPSPIEPDEKIVEADEPSLPEDVASQTEEEEDNVELSMKTNNGESESPLIPEEDSNKDGRVSPLELSKPAMIDDDENANVLDLAEEPIPESITETHGRLPIKPPPPYSVAVKSIIESPKAKEMFSAIEEMTGGRGIQKDTQDDEEVESDGDSDSSTEPNLVEAIQQRRETAIDDGPTDEYIEDDYFTKSDYQAKDIPLKPPPPYSPSSSLESTSLSGKSLLISLDNDKIEKVVQEQAEYVWDRWIRGEFQGEQDFPDIDEVMHELHLNLPEERTELSRSAAANPEIVQTAVLSFDYLLRHLTWFIIKEVLQVESPHDTFIDNVRPGPLVLQAQKLKLPKTKEALINTVMARVTDDMRPSFIPESVEPELEPKKKRWCSRHRELVDEILLDELVNEDYQWTEWWPEEAVVKHNASLEIIRGLVKGALRNRRYVNNQN